MDPAGELAQLVERRAQLGVGLAEQLGGAVGLGAERGSRELQREPEREQPLLGAVMQIALEPAALLVSGGDDPRARGAQFPLEPATASRTNAIVTRTRPHLPPAPGPRPQQASRGRRRRGPHPGTSRRL